MLNAASDGWKVTKIATDRKFMSYFGCLPSNIACYCVFNPFHYILTLYWCFSSNITRYSVFHLFNHIYWHLIDVFTAQAFFNFQVVTLNSIFLTLHITVTYIFIDMFLGLCPNVTHFKAYPAELKSSVGSLQDLRTGGCEFNPWAHPVFFLRIDDSHWDRSHSFLTAVHCFHNGYEGKQPVAWKHTMLGTGKKNSRKA